TIPLRAREMVIKLAAIFSIPATEGDMPSINVEHIRAAQKLTADLIKYKIEHCKTVIGAQSSDSTEKCSALQVDITSVLKSFGSDRTTRGIIRNRRRSFDRQEGQAGIKRLVDGGRVREHRYRD